jgi:hypothetical protein
LAHGRAHLIQCGVDAGQSFEQQGGFLTNIMNRFLQLERQNL